MSDNIIDPNGSMANEARDATGQVLDAQGRAMNQAKQTANQAQQAAREGLDQVGDYVRQQPVSAALIALGVGYIIGRLRIL